jgi:hypothetical protein
MLLCLKMETELASETRFFKKLMMDKILNKQIVSVNFHHAVFSLLGFLNLRARTDHDLMKNVFDYQIKGSRLSCRIQTKAV